MKKFLAIALVIGLALFAGSAFAKEKKASGGDKYVAGGFEMAGHIMTGAGYQHFTNKASTYLPIDSDGVQYEAGPMGKYIGTGSTNRSDHFSFFVDEVELDIMKSFGENIRLRADLDFLRTASSGWGSNGPFILEQAYATANIPIGNGVEFLIGRFNAPIGFESADASENDTISKSVFAEGLRPTNYTGMKIYYAFSDLVDLHFYVVNKLFHDTDVKKADAPSLGFRLGFNWGEEGTESTVGISGMFGPESGVSNKHYYMGGDVDLNWWITESFALGAEALFGRQNKVSFTPNITTNNSQNNVTYVGGLLNLHYLFSDVWDGTLKYSFAKQYKANSGATIVPAGTSVGTAFDNMDLLGGGTTGAVGIGIRQAVHQIALAGGYAIADGAKFKLEGRMDIVKHGKNTGIGTQYVYGGAMAFAYNF